MSKPSKQNWDGRTGYKMARYGSNSCLVRGRSSLRLEDGRREAGKRAELVAQRERLVSRLEQRIWRERPAAAARGAGAGGRVCARHRPYRRAAGVSRGGDSDRHGGGDKRWRADRRGLLRRGITRNDGGDRQRDEVHRFWALDSLVAGAGDEPADGGVSGALQRDHQV